jgi:hypothetical protein
MVATDWTALGQIALGAAAAIGGGAASSWLQGKSQERIEHRRLHREEGVERQQRRERAASALAEVSTLLHEIRAHRSFFAEWHRKGESDRQRAERLFEWLDPLHEREQAASEQLILMAVREPDPEVRRLARQLAQAMHDGVYRTTMFLIGRAIESDAPIYAQLAAQGDQFCSEAQGLLDKLIDAL